MDIAVGRIATSDELPIIDIRAMYGSDAKQKELVAEQMRKACIDVGFFYVIGHRITEQQHLLLLQSIKDLFHLPLEAKQNLAAALSPLHRGYTGLGGSHNCTQDASGADQKESFLLGTYKWFIDRGCPSFSYALPRVGLESFNIPICDMLSAISSDCMHVRLFRCIEIPCACALHHLHSQCSPPGRIAAA